MNFNWNEKLKGIKLSKFIFVLYLSTFIETLVAVFKELLIVALKVRRICDLIMRVIIWFVRVEDIVFGYNFGFCGVCFGRSFSFEYFEGVDRYWFDMMLWWKPISFDSMRVNGLWFWWGFTFVEVRYL